ncbi:YdcF family protein [Streptomyces rectiviolaceus]
MLVYAPAALLFLVFCVRVVRERRKFSNAVVLGLAILCALAAWIAQLVRSGSASGQAVAWALLVLGALSILVLTCFLFLNGLQVVRKEGRSPTNLLSLVAALCMLTVVGLLVTAVVVRTPVWVGVGATASGLAAYLAFLFLCFVFYAFLYGRLRVRRKADYVVVLGSGLVGGSTVPPLLASRLKRAQAVHARLAERGGSPVLITSGGQGPDEDVPESHAMADHLIAHGFPADLIEREDRSTTTEENLRFSKAIMERTTPDYRCVVVTNNYHAFRAALTARRTGIRGQVVGAPTAAYFWPIATIREFAAILVAYKRTNVAIGLLLVLAGVLAWWARQQNISG